MDGKIWKYVKIPTIELLDAVKDDEQIAMCYPDHPVSNFTFYNSEIPYINERVWNEWKTGKCKMIVWREVNENVTEICKEDIPIKESKRTGKTIFARIDFDDDFRVTNVNII